MNKLTINELLQRTQQERMLFFGDAIIPTGASSKPRRLDKRRMVIENEMAFLVKQTDISLFPLAADVRKS